MEDSLLKITWEYHSFCRSLWCRSNQRWYRSINQSIRDCLCSRATSRL